MHQEKAVRRICIWKLVVPCTHTHTQLARCEEGRTWTSLTVATIMRWRKRHHFAPAQPSSSPEPGSARVFLPLSLMGGEWGTQGGTECAWKHTYEDILLHELINLLTVRVNSGTADSRPFHHLQPDPVFAHTRPTERSFRSVCLMC